MTEPSAFERQPRGTLPLASPLRAQYDHLRARLETLLSQPIKDMPAVDALVDELERVQLALKGEMGIKGNNPEE